MIKVLLLCSVVFLFCVFADGGIGPNSPPFRPIRALFGSSFPIIFPHNPPTFLHPPSADGPQRTASTISAAAPCRNIPSPHAIHGPARLPASTAWCVRRCRITPTLIFRDAPHQEAAVSVEYLMSGDRKHPGKSVPSRRAQLVHSK